MKKKDGKLDIRKWWDVPCDKKRCHFARWGSECYFNHYALEEKVVFEGTEKECEAARRLDPEGERFERWEDRRLPAEKDGRGRGNYEEYVCVSIDEEYVWCLAL